MTTPFIRSTMNWVSKAGIDPTEMYWFDMSGVDGSSAAVEVDWLRDYRPPFEKCMVAMQRPTKSHALYEVLMTVVGTDPEEGIVISMHKGAYGEMPRALPMMVYLVDGEAIKYGPVEEGDVIPHEEAELVLGLVSLWYSCMAKGVQAYIPSVRKTFTNRRKIAAGKTPTYDWTTVVIEPKASRVSERLGGTHASPRLHDRRGHLRRLRSGKNVWVRPCKVGKAELGTVFHDYEVRAA